MRGLKFEIKCVEETIAIKKRLGEDASFEKGLVKEWKRYLEGGDKNQLWMQHSYSGRRD